MPIPLMAPTQHGVEFLSRHINVYTKSFPVQPTSAPVPPNRLTSKGLRDEKATDADERLVNAIVFLSTWAEAQIAAEKF
ncbi:MAG: hypothetical protein P0Y59_03985 [Candidatus Sphingomonas phytovorans]|nr:hypothetical protein [Sphingomonas sp.]WEK00866.1 MAG: hypothetical protein P0Y59_03985 [Sphingomonas sp.]